MCFFSIKHGLMTQVALLPVIDAIASPFWSWDSKSGRYRDRSTGRFLSQQNLERLQGRHIALIKKDIDAIADLLLRRQISLETWQEATVKSLKTLHLHQMVLARGGMKQVTASDYLAVGRQLRSEYSYLKQFAIDVNRGYSLNDKGQQVPMTEMRFKARLSLYARSGRVSYEQGKQEVAKSQGKPFMQRFLGIAHHCDDCLRYAAMGVQPTGTLPLPTQRCRCRSHCKCFVRFYSTLAEAIASTKVI